MEVGLVDPREVVSVTVDDTLFKAFELIRDEVNINNFGLTHGRSLVSLSMTLCSRLLS